MNGQTEAASTAAGRDGGPPRVAERKLRVALPNKGRLASSALELLERAGLEPLMASERALRADLGDDFTALFVRARDIPEFVADGAADLGITGSDLVAEAARPVETLLPLGFGRCRLVLAGRDDAATDPADLPDGVRIATSFPRTAERWFAERGRRVTLVPVSGAAEIAPHLGVADVIVDLVSTGSTLKVNGLRELATIADSEAVLVARPGLATGDRGRSVRELVAALESVLRANGKRYLMANVPRAALPELTRVLPGLNGPTIVDVMNAGEHVAAHAVVEAAAVYRTIAALKELGAEGILVTRIERLMP
ncbi:MAG TPA: ATP phosphoribosyltransferase [Longimicrobiales bacterium]|nr:ATP phosphoribosyltransferase [Longimicrobiales bacterium]